MIIFGWRDTARELGMFMAQCRSCGMQGRQRIYRVITWFTLFFLPVVPLLIRRKAVCGTCGATQKLAKADADRLAAHAQAHGPQTYGSQPTGGPGYRTP